MKLRRILSRILKWTSIIVLILLLASNSLSLHRLLAIDQRLRSAHRFAGGEHESHCLL